MTRIVDLHCHIVPGVDDGAREVAESLEMMKIAQSQGVTDIFCTSHNGYSEEEAQKYLETLELLKSEAVKAGISINLHKGTEILCGGEYMEDILFGLEIGAFQTLGNSKCVLTELYPDARIAEALQVVEALKSNGYIPIIAHMERNVNITGLMTRILVNSGALIQVNAYSLEEEIDEAIKGRARELLAGRLVHFIGSDAHRTTHRPPKLDTGASYILNNTDAEYAEKVLCGNALSFLLNK